MEDDFIDTLAKDYLDVFSCKAGYRVLADLRGTFGSRGVSREEDLALRVGEMGVVDHIESKLKALGKKVGAQIIFESECI